MAAVSLQPPALPRDTKETLWHLIFSAQRCADMTSYGHSGVCCTSQTVRASMAAHSQCLRKIDPVYATGRQGMSCSTSQRLIVHRAADVLEWMRKCVAALNPDGLLIVKENICASGFVVDEEDSSLTRSDAYLQARL